MIYAVPHEGWKQSTAYCGQPDPCGHAQTYQLYNDSKIFDNQITTRMCEL